MIDRLRERREGKGRKGMERGISNMNEWMDGEMVESDHEMFEKEKRDSYTDRIDRLTFRSSFGKTRR